MSEDYITDDSPIIESAKPHVLKVPDVGAFKGLQIGNSHGGIKSYRYTGIPYAQAPIGDLRWRRPRNLPSTYDYSGDYTKFRAVCPQLTDGAPTRRSFDEDCLFLNIWIPSGIAPSSGWPVLFYIHGGWLQGGTPLDSRHADPQDIQFEKALDHFIVVAPTYRLNILGFLSMDELLREDNGNTNFGLWDIRMALEWTNRFIPGFQGDKKNITIGGVSAGAYAALCQLAYEIYHEDEEQIIGRVFLESNGISFQPKTVSENRPQISDLLYHLNIDDNGNPEEIVKNLRGVPANELMVAISKLGQSMFRPVTDNQFISKTFAKDIYSGVFGQKLAKSRRSFLIGEVSNELAGYRDNGAPENIHELSERLKNMYPDDIVKILLEIYPTPALSGDVTEDLEKIKDLFGAIVSDMQVHVAERLLIRSLIIGGVSLDKIHRYKIDYRAEYVDKYMPSEKRVTHGSDTMIWFYPVICGVKDCEKPKFIDWLQPYCKWLKGEAVSWGTISVAEYRKFCLDGTIQIEHDDVWEWSEKICSKLQDIF